MPDNRPRDNRTIAAAIVTVLLWGTAFPAIRAALHYYTPGQVALFRIVVGAVTLAIYTSIVRMPLPNRRDLPRLIAVALFGVTLYHGFLNYGLISVSSGPASMLVNMAPVFTAIMAALFLGEVLTGRVIAGLACCMAGAALIGLGEGKGLHFAPGAIFVVAAAFIWSLNIVFQKSLLARYSALQVASASLWLGVIGLFVFAPGLVGAIRTAPLGVTLALVYTGIFPVGVVYATWAYVLSRLPASKAASLLYLIPLVAGFVAWIALGERPGWLSIAGAAVVLVGVLAVNSRRKRPSEVSVEAPLP